MAIPERLLEIRELSTHFETDEGTIKAVDAVTFHIDKGETVAVVGESGSGKSVMSLSIMGLVAQPPGRLAGGEIVFDGKNLLDMNEREMRQIRGNEISMIFQEPMTSLNPVFTVGNQITETIVLHQGTSHNQARKLAIEMLELVGIPEPARRLESYPHQMSGGMRQRVMIAMALSCGPRILIADEPTTALDVTIQAQILDLMGRLQREFGMSILFITHDLGVVAEIADRVVVMYAGRVVEEGDVAGIFSQPRMPYTMGLLDSIPRVDKVAVHQRRLRAIPGNVPNALSLPFGCAFHPRCRFATTACEETVPPLETAGDGRAVRCVRWRDLGEEREMGEITSSQTPVQLEDQPAADDNYLLDVRSLRVYFPIRRGLFSRVVGNVKAVQDISFTIRAGEVVGLVGESGSGKTTAGRTILRLTEPTAGEVLFKGVDIATLTKLHLREYRKKMQIIFQDPFASLNPRMTVEDIISEAFVIHHIAWGKDKHERAANLLELVGLSPDHLRRYPHEFSGGQRQRIGIARALAVDPQFVVADEPVSALDVSIQAQIVNLLQDLRKDLGLTLLFIAHDLSVVEYISDRVIVMYLGRIMEIAEARELYANPIHPYTQALLSGVPIPDPSVKRDRILLKGEIPSPIDPPSGCVFRTRCPIAIAECAELVPPLEEARPGHFKACLRSS